MHLFVRNISIDKNVREYCGGQGADNIVAYIGTHSRVYKISFKTRDLIFIIRPSGEAPLEAILAHIHGFTRSASKLEIFLLLLGLREKRL